MFCEKCGGRISDGAGFCGSCGKKIEDNSIEEKVNKDKVLLEIKPTTRFRFFWLTEFIEKTITAIVLIPMAALFSALIMILVEANQSPEELKKWLYICCGIFLLCILIRYIVGYVNAHLRKKQYENITYTFYPDRVMFDDPFLNKKHHELKYKHIREISKTQTIIQRWFKIGDINFSTNAEGENVGLSVYDIEDLDNYYKQVKEIIKI